MTSSKDKKLLEVHKLTRLLDSSIKLPGGIRIGLDGILGLIPGIGDTITTSLSSLIIYKAYQLGASRSVLFVMISRVLLDFIVGSIPIAGDIFDIVYKSNTKNLLSLEAYLINANKEKTKSRISTAAILIALLLTIVIPIWVFLMLIDYIFFN